MLLITMAPGYIKSFCKANPLKWVEDFGPYGVCREDIQRRGKADIMSPTPCADVFFRQLKERDGRLMTQKEYADHACYEVWEKWYQELPMDIRKAYKARLYHNFYPSFIDSLHVWAMLATMCDMNSQPVFNRCIIDTHKDVVKKTDLILYRGEESIRVALMANTRANRETSKYKRENRGNFVNGTVELMLDTKRPKEDGNKRWFYWPEDFEPIFRKVEQLWLIQESHLQESETRSLRMCSVCQKVSMDGDTCWCITGLE